ncbi:MAG: sigma-54 dependent transcriptional regulator [Bacillota bacterium]|nr:sigma-54 dependent transcriptional regulator [Bacillota bacterium]
MAGDNLPASLQPFFFDSRNPAFRKTLQLCRKAATSSANLLLAGESGTGKEVLAHYVRCTGERRDGPFVAVNCSSYTETLLESELFGHEQGSFTGATTTKQGKLELAEKGIFFLDEVGDISQHTQLKLLRVLETKCVERIGSTQSRKIDFRLISATNVDLRDAIQNGVFREDFFYRISTIVIPIPPLRERPEDLPSLVDFFLKQSSAENNIPIVAMEKEAERFLYEYDYPGNIRELKSIIDRMVIFSEKGVVTRDGIPVMHSYYKDRSETAAESPFSEIVPFQQFKRNSEREYLNWVLGQVGGNVAEAARQLQMSSRQLFNKINDLELKK